jgi:hypothetical protein
MKSKLQRGKRKSAPVTANLNRTLRDLEKSLHAWDNVTVVEPTRRESELSLRTHMLFLLLKEQIDELSGGDSGARPRISPHHSAGK